MVTPPPEKASAKTGRARTYDEKQYVLDRLLMVWDRHPDLRLGQLLVNALSLGGKSEADLFDIEDYGLAEYAEEFTVRYP